jgi:hypothetical protein
VGAGIAMEKKGFGVLKREIKVSNLGGIWWKKVYAD